MENLIEGKTHGTNAHKIRTYREAITMVSSYAGPGSHRKDSVMEEGTRYCLALYSSRSNCISAVTWFEFALDWCDRLGAPADAVWISGEGCSAGPQKPNDAHAQLQRAITIEDVEVYRTLPGYKQLVFGWEFGCTFHTEQQVLAAGFPRQSAEDPFAVVGRIAEDAVRKGQVGYGIAYERELSKGPLLYAVGISAGLGYSHAEMHGGIS